MNQQQKGIHYFPGHMAKALKSLGELSRLCDIIIEIADARAPESTRNPLLMQASAQKPRLLLLNKEDLADPKATDSWIAFYADNGIAAKPLSAVKKGVYALIGACLADLSKAKREKEKRYGMKRQPLKLAVFGIPNVGKSTFVNSLAGKKAARAADRPGVTRAEQWIKIGNEILLLDTPGILPMNYEDRKKAVNLALLGSIKEEVLPTSELASELLAFLNERYPDALKDRYGYEAGEPLEAIAKRRGLLLKEGKPDISRTVSLLLKEFRSGALGRLSLEFPDA